MSKETQRERLAARREEVLRGGGEQKIEEQHRSGKLTARERIAALLDEESFVELDQFVTHRATEFGMTQTTAPGDGVVTGYGTIEGRLVYVFAQDYTVLGGSVGEMHAAKICKVMDLAVKVGAPLIGISDSGGVRLQEGLDALSGYGEILKRQALMSGVVPQIAMVMGPCAGSAALSPALGDFVLMSDQAAMFLTGPQVIKAAGGGEMSVGQLGGALPHNSSSGVSHLYAADEAECIAQARRLLGFLPANNLEGTPVCECHDPAERVADSLAAIIPEERGAVYDMKEIVSAVADHGDFLEIQPLWAQNILVGFIRLNGVSVGVVANQPLVLEGGLDIDAVDKASRFVRFCDSLNIPLLTFVDTPGYQPSAAQEQAGLIRHSAKLFFAYAEATTPKLTVVTRRAYGNAYLTMCAKPLGADQVIAWPTAEIAAISAEGAAQTIYREEIAQAADPQAEREEKIAAWREQYAAPYAAAARGLADVIIEPEYTRCCLIKALEPILSKKEARPGKKHGNQPC